MVLTGVGGVFGTTGLVKQFLWHEWTGKVTYVTSVTVAVDVVPECRKYSSCPVAPTVNSEGGERATEGRERVTPAIGGMMRWAFAKSSPPLLTGQGGPISVPRMDDADEDTMVTCVFMVVPCPPMRTNVRVMWVNAGE